MVSWSSNVDSDGIPVDHDGEQLEDTCWFDGLHGHVGGVDSVMVSLLSPNPSFQGDVSHGESKADFGHVDLGVPVEGELQSDAMSTSGDGHSICNDVFLNGEEVDQSEKKEVKEGVKVAEDVEVGCSSGMKTKRGVKLPKKRKANVIGEPDEGEKEDGGNNDGASEQVNSSIEPMNEEVKDEVV